jgi:RNA polymerase sigma factor (sigma-70 family)
MNPTPLEKLIRAAADGDQAAWNAIVDRFQGLVWSTARAHRLSHADAAEVAQTTWLRLVENLGRIREPEKLAGWLATTARRESLRLIRVNGRELPNEDIEIFESPTDERPELALLTEERDATLWRAFTALSERCQGLLRLLVSEEEPSYETISAALDMPIGAIGPTRMRCLEKLRAALGLDFALPGGLA